MVAVIYRLKLYFQTTKVQSKTLNAEVEYYNKQILSNKNKNAEVEYNNKQILSNKNNSASLWKTIWGALPTKLHHNLEYTREMFGSSG